MIKILINGALGRMGKKVYEATLNEEGLTAVCGVDIKGDLSNPLFPVYDSFACVDKEVDVLIDFSAPASLDNIIAFVKERKIPAVLCATGYTESDMDKVKALSKEVAIFRSANMSLGVNVLVDLVKKAANALYGFDIEIIEKHHNKKVDAPSGTAVMLADAIKKEQPEKFCVYGREGIVGKRNANEIGVHAVRGGNIVGDHDVIFAGENEVVTLSHQAFDRAVFATGAVRAAKYIYNKCAGIYDMTDLLNGK